jgi:hypothetical protein
MLICHYAASGSTKVSVRLGSCFIEVMLGNISDKTRPRESCNGSRYGMARLDAPGDEPWIPTEALLAEVAEARQQTSQSRVYLNGFGSSATTGLRTLVMVSRNTVTRRLGAISTSISLASICFPSLFCDIGTRCTVPKMPPPVTTLSPRFRAASIWRVSFCFCCCGRINRK